MRSRDFPSCCAINLMTDFGYTRTAYYTKEHSKEEIQEFIKDSMRLNRRIHMIVLNSEQLKKIGRKTFTELGFKIQLLGLYTGHMNKIYLLTKHPDDNKPK